MIKADDKLKTVFGGKVDGQHVRDDQVGREAPQVNTASASEGFRSIRPRGPSCRQGQATSPAPVTTAVAIATSQGRAGSPAPLRPVRQPHRRLAPHSLRALRTVEHTARPRRVISPFSNTTCPLTMTTAKPSAYWWGASNVARSFTVAGSNTRCPPSCRRAGGRDPRGRRRAAGNDVIFLTASSSVSTCFSRT